MIGTIINIIAILLGSTLGMLFRSRLPRKLTEIAFQVIGIFTLFLGIFMAMKTANFVILIFGVLIGSLLGEIIDLETRIDNLGNILKKRFKSKDSRFSEGMVTAFLLFCMGSVTVLGAIEEGLGEKPDLLLAKSILDGFSSIALASAMGIGVAFSVVPLFIYQGGLTLISGWLGNFIPTVVIDEMSAAGGLILIGLSLRILEIKQIRVMNMLPALLTSALLAVIFL